jgi:hypothetical protein
MAEEQEFSVRDRVHVLCGRQAAHEALAAGLAA